MLSNVVVDVTIPRCSFVFGQSRAKVSAGFTNVRSLAVAVFDLVYCSIIIIPSTDVIQLTLTLKMTTAQVVETSVTVNNNSPIQDYVHPDDQTQPTFEMTPGFKPFTIFSSFRRAIDSLNSLLAPTKLVPLSDQISLGGPLLLMNWRRIIIKSSVSSEGVASKYTARVVRREQTSPSFRGSAAPLDSYWSEQVNTSKCKWRMVRL